jgi:hypothetical protein
MNTLETSLETIPAPDAEKQDLNKRLEAAALGLFLIMIGGLWLVPDRLVPHGVWSLGVGLILLGLNAARYFSGIRMSRFTIVLGILALITGAGAFFGMDLPVFAILLMLLGANLILKPWFEQKQIF